MPHTSLLVTPHDSHPSAAPRRYNALPGAQAAVRQLAADGRAVQGLLTGNLEATAALKLATAGFDSIRGWYSYFRAVVYISVCFIRDSAYNTNEDGVRMTAVPVARFETADFALGAYGSDSANRNALVQVARRSSGAMAQALLWRARPRQYEFHRAGPNGPSWRSVLPLCNLYRRQVAIRKYEELHGLLAPAEIVVVGRAGLVPRDVV
jgi:hypothetical protein